MFYTYYLTCLILAKMAGFFSAALDVVKKTPFLEKALSWLPVVGPFVQTGLQFAADSIAANKQRKIARELADYQNTYNSPVEQMKRYEAAGMNPAYGSANFNNSAVPFSNAATTVARPVIPESTQILSGIEDYQNIRNAKIQGEILRSRVGQALTALNFLNDTYDDRVQGVKLSNSNSQARYDSTVSNLVADIALKNLKGMLMNQDYAYKTETNPITKRILELTKDMNESGLNSSDDSFLRVLFRKMSGNSSAKDLFPYVLGDRAANFVGDLIKIGIPSGALKGVFNNPSRSTNQYFRPVPGFNNPNVNTR